MHDPAHRPTADALDAAHKLCAASTATAVVVPHPGDDVADRQVVPPMVRLIKHLRPSAALAGHAQEPRREGVERLVQGFAATRQRVIAVAATVALWDRAAGQFSRLVSPVRSQH